MHNPTSTKQAANEPTAQPTGRSANDDRRTDQRRTEQRRSIVRALSKSDRALSAQELHDELKGVGLATVYRNLGRLADEGEIDSIRRPNGETAYRACGSGHHHHLICRDCGKVVELHGCTLSDWSSKIAGEHGFSAVEHQAELFGTCADCAAR
jgi:Fur family transcriptional regulator, ferric uptake regulator